MALVIALVAAYFMPPDDSTLPWDPTASQQVVDTQPTIELPDVPVDIGAGELRSELLEMGEAMLARFPQSPEALHVVAMMNSDLRRTTEAERIWRQCIELEPKQVGPYVGLAGAAMDLGKDETAVETIRQAFAVGLSSPDLYHELAAALTKLGRLDEAAEVIQQGLAAFPEAADNWMQLGQVQTQLGQLDEAEDSLQTAITKGIQNGRVFFALATVYTRQGKPDEAERYHQAFANWNARHEKPRSTGDRFQIHYDAELRRIAVASLGRAGAVYNRQGQLADAERLFLRALSLDPENEVICGELAVLYRRLERIADAHLLQQRLVEIEPANVMHHVNLASLSMHLGEVRAAEDALKRAIALRPDMALGYASLAQLYLHIGEIEQARWFAEAALRQRTAGPEETARTYVVLAAACQELGDTEAAKAAMTKARELAPHDPQLKHADFQLP